MVHRPAHVSRWHCRFDDRDLVAVIEETGGGGLSVREGPASTQQRLSDAMRQYLNVMTDVSVPDVGPHVPLALSAAVGKHVDTAIAAVLTQYGSLAEETDVSAPLKERLQSDHVELDGWN